MRAPRYGSEGKTPPSGGVFARLASLLAPSPDEEEERRWWSRGQPCVALAPSGAARRVWVGSASKVVKAHTPLPADASSARARRAFPLAVFCTEGRAVRRGPRISCRGPPGGRSTHSRQRAP